MISCEMQHLHRFLLVNRIINRIKIEIRKVFFAINNDDYMYTLPFSLSLSLSISFEHNLLVCSARYHHSSSPSTLIFPSLFLACHLFIRNCSVYRICAFIMHARTPSRSHSVHTLPLRGREEET